MQMLIQSTSAAMSVRWELRRMADQVFPLLLQLFCWFDIDTLTKKCISYLSKTDNEFLHISSLLSIKYMLRVIHELIEEHINNFHSKSMIIEIDTVLPLIAKQITQTAQNTDSIQIKLLIVEILVLIHSKIGLQMNIDTQSNQIQYILNQLIYLKENGISRRNQELEIWILSCINHFFPLFIKTCSIEQQIEFLKLFTFYISNIPTNIDQYTKISSLQCIDIIFSNINRNNKSLYQEYNDSKSRQKIHKPLVDALIHLLSAENQINVKLQQHALQIVQKLMFLEDGQKKLLLNTLRSLHDHNLAMSNCEDDESDGGSWDSWDESSQEINDQINLDSLNDCIKYLT